MECEQTIAAAVMSDPHKLVVIVFYTVLRKQERSEGGTMADIYSFG